MDKHPERLWDKAFASLKDEDKLLADPQKLDKRTFLVDLTRVIEEKRQNCAKKEWKLSRNGKSVSVREVFGKMVSWINKFKQVGDVAIQYDPAHAALPWAAVRLVLEAVVNEYHTNEALLEGLEYITSLIARYAMVEGLYLSQATVASEQLSDAVIRLYIAVLIYLAKAESFYSRNTGGRFVKAVVQPVELSVNAYLQKVHAEEMRVNDIARFLTPADKKLDALDQGIQDLQITLTSRIPTQKVSQEQLLSWVDAVFTREEYERALAARIEGSCNWVLKRSELLNWVTSNETQDVPKILWIWGPAGFGKSILCARLIDYLRHDLHRTVAYFFCSFADEVKRQPRSILRSWITQLALQNDNAMEVAQRAFLERQSPIATDQDLWFLFKRLNAQVKNCMFVVDGYDECIAETLDLKTHATSNSRAAFLKGLISSTESSSSHLLLVSREDHDIREQLTVVESSSRSYKVFRFQVTQEDTRDDVNSVSNYLVDQRLPNKSEELRKDLGSSAAEKCEGMFLWVRLLHERLSPGKNARQLKKIVLDTPTGLTQAYERDLEAIHDLPEDEKDRAIMTLRWTLYAFRPLTVQELTEALLIGSDDGDSTYPVEDLPDAYDEFYVSDQLRRLCGSLIDVRAPDHSSDIPHYTVQFVHFSVKEYLLQALQLHFPTYHGMSVLCSADNDDLLAQHCLQYLCYDEFKQDSLCTEETFDHYIKKYAFLRYASIQWFNHASRAKSPSSNLISLSNMLHNPPASRWRLYSAVLVDEDVEDFAKTLNFYGDKWPTPLHLACESGVAETVEYLLDQGVDIDAIGGADATALQKAARLGHVKIFKLLLDRGANPFIKGGQSGSAINAAATPESGSAHAAESMVRLLLSRTVDIECLDDAGRTPLHYAASTGATKVVKLLLDAGSALDAVTHKKWSALHIACEKGHEEVVSLLLSKGADAALQFEDDDEELDKGTALHIATARGSERTISALLDHGVNSHSLTKSQLTTLHFATRRESDLMTRLLLKHGIEVNARTVQGWTALHMAAEAGNEPLVEALLEHGADVSAAGGRMSTTPCHLAVQHGHEGTLRLLIDKGADIETGDIDGRTSLYHAVALQRENAVKCLLDHKANIEARDNNGWTRLLHAAAQGYMDILQLLLKHGGANPNTKTETGWTAFLLAASNGHAEIIHLLIDHVDLNATTESGWTALHAAAENGHIEIIYMLMKHVDLNSATFSGWTALHAAAEKGHVEIIHLSINHVDLNSATVSGRTALHVAAAAGHEKVVEVLLKAGADPERLSKGGWLAVRLAIFNDHRKVVNMFLDCGVSFEVRDGWGRTPLHYSCQASNEALISQYLKHGCDVNAADYLGETPLMASSTLGSRAPICQASLLDAEALIDQADLRGLTALHHAVIWMLGSIREKYRASLNMFEIVTGPNTLPETGKLILDSLLSHGADPARRDNLGWSCLDWASRYPTVLNHLLLPGSTYNPPIEEEVTHIRCLSLQPAVHHLISLMDLKKPRARAVISGSYSYVGSLLLASKYLGDAKTAYMASMTRIEGTGQAEHAAHCDLCSETITGDRFICESCPDTDLCSSCYKLYRLDPNDQPARIASLGSCKGHPFYHVSEEEWRNLPESILNEQGEDEASFVERLSRTYG